MRQFFGNLSINSKLTGMLISSMLLVLLLTSGAFVFSQLIHSNQKASEHLAPLAAVLGNQATAALIFSDAESAQRDLQSLSSQSSVLAAYIYNLEHQIFAAYPALSTQPVAQIEINSQIALSRFDEKPVTGSLSRVDGNAHFIQALTLGGETVGYIQLVDNLSQSRQAIRELLNISLIIVLVAGLTALLLALVLPRFVSRPLRRLNAVTKLVTQQGDHSLRATKESNDEIGELVDGFNAMLSEVQQRDKSLQAHSENLESQVQQRTAEMRKAMHIARTANEAKSHFLANFSHDIRTPMSAIMGLTQLLEQTNLTHQQAKYVGQQKKAGKLLLQLINEILDLARIKRGQLEIKPSSFSLRDLIEQLTSTIQPLVDQKQLKLKVTLAGDIPAQLSGDAIRFSQVLLNLLANAVKFTATGEVVLEITGQKSAEQYLISVVVTDTGQGIARENLMSIFRPFVHLHAQPQVENQDQSQDGSKRTGLGLGLAISHDLVKLMGGRLVVESTPGEGSRFYFELPFEAVDEVPSDTESVKSKAIPFEKYSLQVLLVEDDPLLQKVHGKLLELICSHVDIVGDGEKALDAVQHQTYDLVLMDLQLPGMDGRQVTQAIRLLDGCHDLPIIALTADGLKESQQRCLQAGMNACLIKPITLEQLAATIRTWTQSEDIPVLSPNEDQMTGLVMPLHKLAEFAGDAAAKNLGKELQDSLPEWRESLDSAMLASDKQQVHRVVHRLLGSSSLWHHPELLTLLKKIDSEQFSQLDTTLRNSMLDQYFADIHLAVSKYITA